MIKDSTQILWHELFLGAAAGTISKLAFFPLDTLRTRLQVGTGSSPTWSEIFQQSRRLGVRGLYAGLAPTLTLTGPATGVYLAAYYRVKDVLESSTLLPSHLRHLFSGFLAEVISGVIWNPLEVVKQRAQISGESSHTLAYRLPMRAFFRGYWSQLYVYGPYSMIYWVLYEEMRTPHATFTHYLSTSAVCAAVSAWLTNPFDLGKTRTQTGQVLEGTSFIKVITNVVRAEGALGLWKGATARMLSLAPSTALAIAIFEQFNSVRNSERENGW